MTICRMIALDPAMIFNKMAVQISVTASESGNTSSMTYTTPETTENGLSANGPQNPYPSTMLKNTTNAADKLKTTAVPAETPTNAETPGNAPPALLDIVGVNNTPL